MLSLEIIQRELDEHEDITVKLSKNRRISEMSIHGVCPLTSLRSLEKDVVYVAHLEDGIFQDTDTVALLNEANAPLVLLGKKAPAKLLAPFVLCQIQPTLDDTGNDSDILLREVVGIFRKYENWRMSMQDAIREENIDKILSVSHGIFHSTLTIVDSTFKNIAAAGPDRATLDTVGHSLPIDFINALKDDTEGEQIHTLKNAFRSPANPNLFEIEPLCYNLFFMGSYHGRLVATPHSPSGFSDFLKSDYALLDELGANIEIIVKQQYATKGFIHEDESLFTSEIYALIKRLLNNEQVEKYELDIILRTRGWSPEENHYAGYLFLNDIPIPARNDIYYCQYILQQYKGVFPICHEGNIILVISQKQYRKADDFIQAFSIFLRENNFRMGISNLCLDMRNLYHYYHQAEIALNYGMQRNSMIWTHKFSDYLLDYLLQPQRNMPTELLCAEEILVLKEYDEKNNSDYLETLQIYLTNRMNAVQTAKRLYIHHATMVFRLKRLKELTGIDFKNTDKMVHLYLSYRMLQNEGKLF